VAIDRLCNLLQELHYLIRKEKYVYSRMRSRDDRFSLVEYGFHRRAFQHDVRLQ